MIEKALKSVSRALKLTDLVRENVIETRVIVSIGGKHRNFDHSTVVEVLTAEADLNLTELYNEIYFLKHELERVINEDKKKDGEKI